MTAVFVSISALLLAVAGIAKVIAPDPASDALGVLGLPSHPALVRLGAGAEVLIAVVALTLSGPIGPALVGVSYLAFAVFVALLRRQPGGASCGCFGGEGEVPTLRHVIVDVIFGVGCLAAAFLDAPAAMGVIKADLLLGVGFLLVSGVAAWLAAVILGAAPLRRAP